MTSSRSSRNIPHFDLFSESEKGFPVSFEAIPTVSPFLATTKNGKQTKQENPRSLTATPGSPNLAGFFRLDVKLRKRFNPVLLPFPEQSPLLPRLLLPQHTVATQFGHLWTPLDTIRGSMQFDSVGFGGIATLTNILGAIMSKKSMSKHRHSKEDSVSSSSSSSSSIGGRAAKSEERETRQGSRPISPFLERKKKKK